MLDEEGVMELSKTTLSARYDKALFYNLPRLMILLLIDNFLMSTLGSCCLLWNTMLAFFE